MLYAEIPRLVPSPPRLPTRAQPAGIPLPTHLPVTVSSIPSIRSARCTSPIALPVVSASTRMLFLRSPLLPSTSFRTKPRSKYSFQCILPARSDSAGADSETMFPQRPPLRRFTLWKGDPCPLPRRPPFGTYSCFGENRPCCPPNPDGHVSGHNCIGMMFLPPPVHP